MDTREILESMDKSELIELILRYSDQGYFPMDLFTMAAMKYSFSLEDLETRWEYVVDRANAFEDDDNPIAADVLSDAAELFFKQAQRLDKDSAESFLQKMIDDLTAAAEEDGIGMKQDSEWMYLQVRDEIEEYLGSRL